MAAATHVINPARLAAKTRSAMVRADSTTEREMVDEACIATGLVALPHLLRTERLGDPAGIAGGRPRPRSDVRGCCQAQLSRSTEVQVSHSPSNVICHTPSADRNSVPSQYHWLFCSARDSYVELGAPEEVVLSVSVHKMLKALL